MERAYDLQPYELAQQQQLDQEHQKALAQYGALTLQIEALRERIPQLEERQRGLVNQVVMRHGIPSFINARIINGNLICQLPDEPTLAPSTGRAVTSDCDVPAPGPALSVRAHRVNGPEHAPVKE